MGIKKKIDQDKQERIHNIVKNNHVITNERQLNRDGMFAKKSRVVGTGITRML